MQLQAKVIKVIEVSRGDRIMKRPELNEVPLSTITDKPSVIITMSTGQWDRFLQAAYDYGHTLLELDENEHPVRAYRKAPDISDALDAAAYFNNEYLA